MCADQDSWTIGRLLNWTAEYLSEHGSPSARLDAEVLLASVRRCERIELYTAFDHVADDGIRTAYRQLVRRRAEGTPVAYLVGHKEFYAMAFEVTPAVLIPRAETEFLVVALLDLAKLHPNKASLRIADIGTGSGVLAITAAVHLPGCNVTATDTSSEALEVAKRNAKTHAVSDRIGWFAGDLFADVESADLFDFVLSNPPYVSEIEYEQLPLHIREHEPRRALFAGQRGTEVIERIVAESTARTATGGWLLLEISPMIEEAVRQIFDSHREWQLKNITKDHAGHARLVQARRI